MNRINKTIMTLSFLMLPGISISATDPIRSILTQGFPSQVNTSGGTYIASYTFTNEIPFTMVNPLIIIKTTNAPSEVTYEDLCSGKRLNSQESCTVSVRLTPTTAGLKIVNLTEAYGHDRVPLPQLATTASVNGGSSGITAVVTTALPQSLNINSSAPWKFTYTNNGSEAATGLNIAVTGSSYNTNCGLNLSNIAPANSCYVQGTYTATSTGAHTITSTLSYSQGSPVAVSTSTNGSGQGSGLVCSAAVPLAPETLINTTNPVTLLCTNKSGSSINITGHTSTYPSGGAQGTFVPSGGAGDNCTPQSLPNNASCQLSGNYTAPGSAASGVTISLSVDYTTTSPQTSNTSTTTDVVTVINNLRKFHLINNCNFDVAWSMVGGAVSDSPSCASCPSGSTCNSAANVCYYNNYGPTTGSYLLSANGGTADTQIVQTAASTLSDQILWKGLISASTNCTGTTCQNNACQNNGGTTSCAPGVGFDQPATEAEFTLKLTGSGNVDSYDISNVNGFSMPISMSTNQSAADYDCGDAGNTAAAGNLNACNYNNMTPPTQMYYWVENTGVACTSLNTCTDTTKICGLAFNPSANNFTKNCGAFLGFWAANQICQTNPNFTSPFGDSFSCKQYLSYPFPDATYTLTQLLKCSPPSTTAPQFNSCYLSYSGYTSTQLAQCCGCSDWAGIATPTASCPVGQTDPQWIQYVLPLIQWMKQACPTSYAYPYDDKASSFQCSASEATEYTITFCPGSQTGLPAGKTDGR